MFYIGDNVDLENWTIKELKDAIILFKDGITKSKIKMMSSRISFKDNKKSKIFDNPKKEKFIYVCSLQLRKIVVFGTFKLMSSKSVKKQKFCLHFPKMTSQESPSKSKFVSKKSLDKVCRRIYFWTGSKE